MNITEDERRTLDEVHALMDRAGALFEHQDQNAVAAVLADLLAQWIAQFVHDQGPRPTAQLHRRLLQSHVETVEKLVRYYRER